MTPPEAHESSYTAAQVLVLERLTRIETLLEINNDSQRETREKAQTAVSLAQSHEKQLEELKEANRWAFRTGIVLACGFLVNMAVNIVQGV